MSTKKIQTIRVREHRAGDRLDRFIAERYSEYSRSYIQTLIHEGLILVNGKPAKPNHKVRPDELIELQLPEPVPLDVEPEDITLSIIYEDSHIVVVNKSAGMVVHPAAGNYSHTLVNALLYHCTDITPIQGVLRPGIVHRLDKNTSGCIVAAKSDVSARSLYNQFKQRNVHKEYFAIVKGDVRMPSGKIDLPLRRNPVKRKEMAVSLFQGKVASTCYEVIERFRGFTALSIRLETGRTHQIRVHMAYRGHPVLGDEQYGARQGAMKEINGFRVQRHMLHARVLGFAHPATKQPMEFVAPLPEDMEEVLQFLRERR